MDTQRTQLHTQLMRWRTMNSVDDVYAFHRTSNAPARAARSQPLLPPSLPCCLRPPHVSTATSHCIKRSRHGAHCSALHDGSVLPALQPSAQQRGPPACERHNTSLACGFLWLLQGHLALWVTRAGGSNGPEPGSVRKGTARDAARLAKVGHRNTCTRTHSQHPDTAAPHAKKGVASARKLCEAHV